MINDNVVPITTSPFAAAPVIIDDSRLQTLWDRQHRRQNRIVGGCCATALLIAGALVVMAFRINAEPPKVTVAAPVVNITNPPPTINVQGGAAPATAEPAATPRTGESKVVEEYTKFTTATVGDYEVHSGWMYRTSKDSAPSSQYCYLLVGRTGKLSLAEDGKVLRSIDTDARQLGIDPGVAENLAKSCRWYAGELRDPGNK
jgi:hypothetical protein